MKPVTGVFRSTGEVTGNPVLRSITMKSIINSFPTAEKEEHIQNSMAEKEDGLQLNINLLTYKIFLGNARLSWCIVYYI